MATTRRTVLVVEDEPIVMDLVRTALTRRGYRVLEAATVDEAERVFEQERGNIDLLLTDMMLSGESGSELARDLRERAPDLRVILTSGYDTSRVDASIGDSETAVFLEKPFSLEELAKTIQSVLDGDPIA